MGRRPKECQADNGAVAGEAARPRPTPAALEPQLIHPNGVYRVESARRALGLHRKAVSAEIRLGRLRAARRCGRYYFLGQWLLEWIVGGEVKRAAPG